MNIKRLKELIAAVPDDYEVICGNNGQKMSGIWWGDHVLEIVFLRNPKTEEQLKQLKQKNRRNRK